MRRNHTGHRVGEDHHRAKGDDALVARVRREYEAGKGGYGALAKRHGIGESTVRDWVKYYTRAIV